MDNSLIRGTVGRTAVQTEGSASMGMTLVCLGKEANKGKAGGTRRRPESGIVVGGVRG